MAKSKHWMSKAFKPETKGTFKAKAEAAGKSTAEFAKEHENSPGRLGKQARLAEVGMKASRSKRWYGKEKD